METMAARISEQISAFDAATAAATESISSLLDLARELSLDDREAASLLLDAAKAVGVATQAREGQLVQLLAQADRVQANRAGLAPWIATHLDATANKARAIAQSAKRVGAVPELREVLSSGAIGADTIRALTRTAKAVAHTSIDQADSLAKTLDLAAREGVTAANRHIRVLEESLDPGRAEKLLAKQRQRSFARITQVESGMTRIECLIDPERATTMRAAIDLYTADVIRTRQYDGRGDVLPGDIRSTEQIQAHALVRMAEVFLNADPEVRGAKFTAPMLYHAPLFPDGSGMAESVYGELIPLSEVAPAEHPAAHLVEHVDGQPVLLDGKPIDRDPTARLASAAQRIALAFRDRKCSYPGCDRPPTWALHAHHVTPHSKGGPTTMANLALYCAEHHTLVHLPQQVP